MSACQNPPQTPPAAAPVAESPAAPEAEAPVAAPTAALPKPTAPLFSPPAKVRTTELSPAQPVAPPPAAPAPTPFSHAGLDSILQKHVSATGKVRYKNLKADRSSLDAYCRQLSENPPLDAWSKREKMAYWINAYNAFTLQLIIDHYPVGSILKLDGGKTWDVRRIRVGDQKMSLNQIENDILRPVFKDARIHFAINCAAKSCPPLWNHAYTADNLESALENRTRAFVQNGQYNQISARQAQVSKIFEWYAADFGDLRAFLNRYSTSPLDADGSIGYAEYNWDLNGD